MTLVEDLTDSLVLDFVRGRPGFNASSIGRLMEHSYSIPLRDTNMSLRRLKDQNLIRTDDMGHYIPAEREAEE